MHSIRETIHCKSPVYVIFWRSSRSTNNLICELMCPFSWQLSVKLFRLIWTQQTTYQLKSLSDDDSDVLTAVVHGVVLGVPFPFNLPNPDGCKDSGVSCPISAGQTYNYKTSLPVLASYPRVSRRKENIQWIIFIILQLNLPSASFSFYCAINFIRFL